MSRLHVRGLNVKPGPQKHNTQRAGELGKCTWLRGVETRPGAASEVKETCVEK